jgi:large conductance mechanosensitive channel
VIKEFTKFIMRGNVLDLAVGIIIGSAFTAIVNSLVNDIIMPPIGLLIGGIDFSEIVITLKAATADQPAVTMNIGLFINAIITFLIVALSVFLMVRAFNSAMERMSRKEKQEAAAAAEPAVDVALETQKQLVATLDKLNAKLDKIG